MKNLGRLLFLYGVLLCCSSAGANSGATGTALRGFVAEYSVNASGMELGRLEVRLTRSGDDYHYSKKTRSSGLMKLISDDVLDETSRGQINSGGPSPLNYQFLHQRKKGNKSEEIRFDADKVISKHNDAEYQLTPIEGLQDRASQELMLMLAAADANPNIEINVVERGKLRTNRYRIVADETLIIDGKKFQTRHVTVERENTERKTDIWLDIEQGFVPVRFAHQDDQSKPTVVTTLKTLNWTATPAQDR